MQYSYLQTVSQTVILVDKTKSLHYFFRDTRKGVTQLPQEWVSFSAPREG